MKVGDVVRVKTGISTNTQEIRGLVGTIKSISRDSSYQDIGVDFGRNIGGNNLNGLIQEGYGFWIKEHDLQIMKPVKEMFPSYWESEWKPKLELKPENKLSIIILEEGNNEDRNAKDFCSK